MKISKSLMNELDAAGAVQKPKSEMAMQQDEMKKHHAEMLAEVEKINAAIKLQEAVLMANLRAIQQEMKTENNYKFEIVRDDKGLIKSILAVKSNKGEIK